MSFTLQSDISSVRDNLLEEFTPDDVCPLGAPLIMDAQSPIDQLGSGDNSRLQVAQIIPVDDDAFVDSFENQAKQHPELVVQNPADLLSVNQLIESVC